MHRVEIHVGDVTTFEVDAIVNAAHASLLGGGGVDGAIHRAAGPGLREECRRLGGCETGSARITEGHDLPAAHVIHAVGPVWNGGDDGEDALLASCYGTALHIARATGLRSIAFPAISCGAFGYPRERAALVSMTAIAAHLQDDTGLERVLLVAFEGEMAGAWARARALLQA
jgi:O-acetyl-ADP-ribose deacetylase (regulator of RNase III)